VHGDTDGDDQETVRMADDTAEIRNKYPRNVCNSESERVLSHLFLLLNDSRSCVEKLSTLVLGRAGRSEV